MDRLIMTQNTWNIELFGPLVATRDHRRISRFSTEKTGILLATLAEEPGQAHWRDELSGMLWPAYDRERGRNCLRIALSWLRIQLEPLPEDRGEIIVADRSQVYLNSTQVTTDKQALESLLKSAAKSTDDKSRIQFLQAAVEQYRNGLLTDYDETWITAERQRLADTYQLAVRRLVRAHVNLRQYKQAVAVAEQAVTIDPRPESHRMLIHVYAKLGRASAALRQYHELQASLHAETARMDLRGPTATEPHQGTQPNGPASAAAVRSRRQEPQLPGASGIGQAKLIGRQEAIRQVREMLDTPETRLVTLTGKGGIGKTRLALAVADELGAQASGTVTTLSLAHLAEVELLVPSIAAALGVTLSEGRGHLDQVRDGLTGKPSVLVLDNVDHLPPAGTQEILRLLESVPTLTCLVTSRNRLGVAEEYEFAVRPLAMPSTAERDEITAFSSCVLWLDRAKTADPSFWLTQRQARDVMTLCRWLEGVPLSIQLVAGWTATVNPTQVLAGLKQWHEYDGSPYPAHTVRSEPVSALDWCWNRLPAHVKQFFARLSVFRTGWTLEAADAVCEEPTSQELLNDLQARTLIEAVGTGDSRRYALQETILEFADSKLVETERARAGERHRYYFMATARKAEAESTGREKDSWFALLTAERDNLRAALRYCLLDNARPELALEFAVSLFWFWYVGGYREEGRYWLTAALERHPSPSNALRERALVALGHLLYDKAE